MPFPYNVAVGNSKMSIQQKTLRKWSKTDNHNKHS